MADWNNQQRGLVISQRTSGRDTTNIVGEDNLVSTPDNRMAMGSIPTPKPATEEPLTPKDLNWSDKSHGADTAGARGYTKHGDPFSGMGGF